VNLAPLNNVLAVEDGCKSARCAIADVNYAKYGVTFDITKGSIEATLFEGGKWKFKGSGVSSKTIAEEVCWTFETKDATLHLTLTDSTGKELAVELKPPAQGETIELRLQNLPDGDIFPVLWDKPAEDTHVDLLFSQSLNRPSPAAVLSRRLLSGSAPKVATLAHTHRLSSVVIGAKAFVLVPAKEKNEGPMPFMGARVNCPPGQWAGSGT